MRIVNGVVRFGVERCIFHWSHDTDYCCPVRSFPCDSTSDRIAVFDNDGTLWSEQPVYFQLLFAVDRLRELAESDPSILTTDALKAAAAGDLKTVLAGGEEALLEIVAASHSGVTVDEFLAATRAWLDTARHPKTGLAYSDMVYQPMLELIDYLKNQGKRIEIIAFGRSASSKLKKVADEFTDIEKDPKKFLIQIR